MFGLALALMCTFLLSGVWHGAAWTFVIWGALHGAGVAFEAVTKKSRRKLAKTVGAPVYEWMGRLSMLAFVTLTFVFFRARSFEDARMAIRQILQHKMVDKPSALLAGLDVSALALGLAGVAVLALSYRFEPIARREEEPGWKQVLALAGVVVVAVLHLNRTSRFIYFAF
jgi:D-alanyl-lipoteichoic acid acyltransferase DltB (MBOAT superfamily)